MKRKLSLMLAVIMLLQIILPMVSVIWKSGFTIKSIAADTENRWDVSENQDGSITANFDSTTGILTISGVGKIKEESFSDDYPWYSKSDEITKVLISNGIENIPTRAFKEYKNLREIKLGNSIKTIEYEAFKDCKWLNSIELPEGLENIDRAVFQNCVRLRSISIPSTVKMIGQEDNPKYGEYQFDVFRGCVKLESISVGENNTNYYAVDGVLFNKDKTKLVYYPEGKITTEYTIPSSVTKVGAYSIYNVTNVTKINVPNGVTAIGDGGFRGCINLSDINIPATVETLGNDVLDDCIKLKNITVDVNNENYSSVNGVLFNKDETTILVYPIGKENTTYTIPSSVTTIGPGAFRSCTKLTDIEIPNSVVNIEWAAFSGCTGLTGITIPDSVNKMGTEVYDEIYFGYIFEGCENLKYVTLPTEIETFYSGHLFKNCSSLEEIIIPKGTDYIGNEAFLGCSNLSSVEMPESVISIGVDAFQGCISLTNIEIPNAVKRLPWFCFQGAGLEIIDIPTEVTSIETNAFAKCRNLKQINIPDTVTSIDDSAFRAALLTIKVETNSNQSYEIELPEIIKRTMDSSDVLYSEKGLYVSNCTLDENKIIAKKDMLEQGKVKLSVKSGSLYGLEIAFEATTYSDTEAPVINDIYGVNHPSSGVFGVGDKVSIRIRTSEFMKGNPPKLKFRFGDGEERIATVSDNWNTNSGKEIEYSYTVQDGDNGLLEVISFEGEELTDWSGNKLVTDNIPKLDEMIVANTQEVALLIGIAVTKAPDNTKYIAGQTFDKTGMKVTATYNDGTSKEITNYIVTPDGALTTSDNKVTISYTENGVTKTAEQAITVTAKTLTGITISKAQTKTEYIEGQTFDNTGMVITATYNNGTSKEVTNYTVTPNGALTTSDNKVTISYTENGVTKTAEQAITVVAKQLTGITISKAPTKIEYIEEQTFDKTGMKVTATYNNGTSKEVTNYTVTPNGALTTSDNKITISYTENGVTKTAEQPITVKAKEEPKPILKGDANGDNKIDFMDILAINKHRLGKAQLEGIYLETADVNGDSKVDFMDILQINKYRLGKIDSL